MSQARGIQYDTVAAVADRLVAAGVKADQISAIMIREETKTGSLTTIINHLRQWRVHATKAVVPTDFNDDDLAAILMVITNKVQEAANRVRNEERAVLEAKLIELDAVKAELHSVLQVNSRLEEELVEAQGAKERFYRKLEVERAQASSLRGEVKALKEGLSRFAPAAPELTQDAVAK